jgi:hypothetical protein
MRSIGSISSLVCVGVLIACGGGGGNDADECAEAALHSDLAFLQTTVFTETCSKSTSCHRGNASSALGLNLEEEPTEADFIAKLTVPSELLATEFPPQFAMDIVTPGNPDQSYMVVILEGAPANLIKVEDGEPVTMPDSDDPLCPEKIGAIRRWIASLPP